MISRGVIFPLLAGLLFVFHHGSVATSRKLSQDNRSVDTGNQEKAFPPEDIDFRPAYHITPPINWMNDPNGLMEYKGIFHVFFQFNPRAPIWGAPYWGHVASRDLVRWRRLPVAIIPDTPYDFDGVFSGSATVVPGQGPVILYTGVSNFTQLGFFHQVQAMARPANDTDDLLVRWIKADENPIIADAPPGGGTNFQFRDPQTAWLQDIGDEEVWLTAVGAQVACVGSAPMYASRDFINWEFFGYLHSQPGLPPFPLGEEQKCNQFGKEGEGRTWEVVCMFPMDSSDGKVYVFKYSDQVEDRVPFGRDWYVLSDLPLNFTNNTVVGEGNAFTPEFKGEVFDPKIVDHGDIYASKLFKIEDGRTLWMAWSFETSTGCTGTCSSGTPLTEARGWQGVQTLPREVTLDVDTAEIILYPIAEVETLRTASLFASSSLDVGPGTQMDISLDFPTGSSRGRQMDVIVTFALEPPGEGQAPFTVGLELVTSEDNVTAVFLNGTITMAETPVVDQLEFWVDRSNTGGSTNSRPQGGTVNLPTSTAPDALSIRLLVDHSILEAFGQGGRVRTTSRIYPEGTTDWGVRLFNRGGNGDASVPASAAVEIWEMDSGFADSI